ncbi:MAG: hypothetical protein LBT47_04755 [Deltaproteobacteria bacterium]|jgi:hypothetical protein|nr:hypothetical protein [Deltaproteobacteria bacterium]
MIRSTVFAFIFGLILAVSIPATAIPPKAADYYSQPPLLVGATKPAILMVLSKDIDIYAPAYVAPADHDGDGNTDVGFNPAVVYTGIFDPYSCYTYNWQKDGTNAGSATDHIKDWNKTPNWIDRGHFVRLGPSIEDVEDSTGTNRDSSRLAKEIANGWERSPVGRPGFRAPRSATGICPAKNKVDGSQDMDSHGKKMTDKDPAKWSTYTETRLWSGNWLNWMTSSRIDVIRQVLYGGKRVVDTPKTTYLAAEYIAENAGVWSYDDFTKYFWLDYNEGAPYYDSVNYTPIDPDRWAGHYRRLHSYGRSGHRFYIYDNIWFMRQKEDVTNHEGFRSYSAYFMPKYRHQYTPLLYILNSFADQQKTAYWEVTVEACRQLTKEEVYDFTSRLDYGRGKAGLKRPANKNAIPSQDLIEAGDYCERYGENFKPVGLLQKYAKLDQALFGLLTGAFNNQNRWDAGWLRHNVTSIRNQINADGTYKGTVNDNIFLMLDSITQVTKSRLTPLNEARTGVDTQMLARGAGWSDPLESNFGNPIGEMLYAGLLYFASYPVWPNPGFMESQESVALPRLGSAGFDPWKSPLYGGSGDCLKPVILLLSSTSVSHDGDMLPGTPHGYRDGAGAIPQLNLGFAAPESFKNAAGLSKSFDMGSYLDVITKLEGFSGQSFYIANLNTGAPGAITVNNSSRQPASDDDTNLCIPRVLTSLSQVRGLCPSTPQTYGTYAAAAVAYYGNTHDFDESGNQIQTFAVALPSIFPKINLTAKGHTISISPVAMSVAWPCGNNDGVSDYCKDGSTDPQGIQYVGPFTTNIIQWRANDQGQVYSGAVFAGFTGRLEGEGDDYQLDAPVRYYFDLIRECYTGECDSNANKALTESFRYESGHGNKEGYPSRDDERDISFVYFHQPFNYGYPKTHKTEPTAKKYAAYNPDVDNTVINDRESSEGRCDDKTYRDLVAGCGSAKERQVAKRIMYEYFKDGRYAAAPFKRHREWVYRSWDHAGRPNYIFSSERPKEFHVAAYMPKRWSQLPAYFHRPTGILTSKSDPDPTLMQSYARLIYPEFGDQYSSSGKAGRQALMRTFPGAEKFLDYTSNNIIHKEGGVSPIDYVFDETESLFIDRPYAEVGYEEVMDVYGYIGEPGRIYKKVTKPEEMKDAIGVAIFVYSLEEKIDYSDRNMPMNIGYYIHGGLNYDSGIENPSRSLGNGEGTYLEIQNEHNYMGGSPQKVLNEGTTVSVNNKGQEFGLMTIAHPLNTPPTCYRAGTANDIEPQNFTASESNPKLFKDGVTGNRQMPGFISDTDKRPHAIVTPLCGSARLPLTSTRFFRFPASGETIEPPRYLPDPLWLAAKYGGFNDENNDGIPQENEFDVLPEPNGDDIPDNYFYANTLSELKEKLSEAFERIMSTMNVGTATSASVNSVLGGGVTVRTYFQTVHSPAESPEVPEIKWLGGTYALFIDLWGNMREDTNLNGQLDLDCGFEGDPGSERSSTSKGDWIVEFVDCQKLSSATERQACYDKRDISDIKTIARVYPDQNGQNYKDLSPSRLQYVSLGDLRTVWNLSRDLSSLTDDEILQPRTTFKELDTSKRRVYYYHEDLFAKKNFSFGNSNLLRSTDGLKLAPYMLQTDSNTATRLIEFILGKDQAGWRSRQTLSPWFDLTKGQPIVCRLGDIINSQPIISGTPFSNYDYIFSDGSYATYKVRYSKRRNLAVVGANDGMLHAINMGFPISLKEGYNGYTDKAKSYIGREMWAFIPQSLLPHLQWLPLLDYAHSYYLDLTPTVVEIKDPTKSEALGGPWRTIIIGSLRFGGRAIELDTNGSKYSYSEVFALDVTDPDTEPVLLWRFTHPQLGLVVARPTVVRNNAQGDNWYVLVGSGPTYDNYDAKTGITSTIKDGPLAYKGLSNQSAKLFVFNAVTGPEGGVTVIDTKRPKSFFTNSQVLTAPQYTVKNADGLVSWRNVLAYFSLTHSALDNDLLCLNTSVESAPYLSPSRPDDFCVSKRYGNNGAIDKGGIWRLYMDGAPSTWATNFKVFFEADRPISGAVNTTVDARGRLWVIFGSGRYWSSDDSRVCEGLSSAAFKACQLNHVNYLYGIKEPVDASGNLTLGKVNESSLFDVSNIAVYPNTTVKSVASDGQTSALVVDGEPLNDYTAVANAILSDSYQGYRRALKTNSTTYIDSNEVDIPDDEKYKDTDWWEGLSYEMILEQPSVAPFGGSGSIMALSTFLPRSVSCGSAGHSYGYILDTFSGLPKPDFGNQSFVSINSFQDSALPDNDGHQAVSDHVSSVGGKSAAAVFVVTGTNEGKRGQFEIVNSDGTVTVFKLPEPEVYKGGIISWREVLDFSNVGGSE